MANIMVRKTATGAYSFYLPKRDLEDAIVAMEFDSPEKWGGEIKLKCASTNWQVIVGESPIQERSSEPSWPRVMRCTSRGVKRSVDRGHRQASHGAAK